MDLNSLLISYFYLLDSYTLHTPIIIERRNSIIEIRRTMIRKRRRNKSNFETSHSKAGKHKKDIICAYHKNHNHDDYTLYKKKINHMVHLLD